MDSMQVQFVPGDACACAVSIKGKKSSYSSEEEKRGRRGSFWVDLERNFFVWKVREDRILLNIRTNFPALRISYSLGLPDKFFPKEEEGGQRSRFQNSRPGPRYRLRRLFLVLTF